MGTGNDNKPRSEKKAARRRTVLKSVGVLVVGGTVGSAPAAARGPPNGGGGPPDDKGGPPNGDGGPPDDERGPPNDGSGDRTIDWEGQGSEHATLECSNGVGYWHWVLTPGGASEFVSVGELNVTFSDGTEREVQGSQKGRGAYHFDVRKAGGGTVDSAFVEVEGGGSNALLTISDGECEDGDTLYWQVDFGAGEVKDPPAYYPADVMAALGNSEDGVTENPSLRRQQTVGQLADVAITGNEFTFDDDDDPSEVTVEFSISEDGGERDLHLSSFVLPGAFDEDEIEQQELEDSTVEEFKAGEDGKLTISVPQRG